MELGYKKTTPMRYGKPDTTERPALLFFAGRSTGSERAHVFHSTIMQAANETPGEIRIFNGQGVNLGEEMSRAKFCLAPPGGGFGTRGTLSIVMGCVPVYVGDLKQPWSDRLDYDEFAIRISEDQLNRTIRIVKEAPYAQLKAGIDRVWPLFHWSAINGVIGGEPLEKDATHFLVEQLRALGANVSSRWGGPGPVAGWEGDIPGVGGWVGWKGSADAAPAAGAAAAATSPTPVPLSKTTPKPSPAAVAAPKTAQPAPQQEKAAAAVAASATGGGSIPPAMKGSLAAKLEEEYFARQAAMDRGEISTDAEARLAEEKAEQQGNGGGASGLGGAGGAKTKEESITADELVAFREWRREQQQKAAAASRRRR